MLSGSVKPRKRFVAVELEYYRPPNGWVTVSTEKVRLRSGKFRAEVPVLDPGEYRARAAFVGDALNMAAASEWVTFNVIAG